jgi:hypothetical protein
MANLSGAPRTEPDWAWNNPRQAALEFVASDTSFEISSPPSGCDDRLILTPVAAKSPHGRDPLILNTPASESDLQQGLSHAIAFHHRARAARVRRAEARSCSR